MAENSFLIAALRQQAGRAGRGLDPSLAVLIATADPIDQFLAAHPDFLFERSPEHALINPDTPIILLDHLRCPASSFLSNPAIPLAPWIPVSFLLTLPFFKKGRGFAHFRS